MTPIEQRKRRVTEGIFGMLATWTIAVLSLEASTLLAFVVDQFWFPVVILAVYLLKVYLRHASRFPIPSRNRVSGAVGTSLILSIIIIVVILCIGDSWEPGWLKPQPRNHSIPYIAILIVAPVMALATFRYRWCMSGIAERERYRVKFGTYAERDFLEELYMQESSLQLEVLFGISAIVGIVVWVYYFKYYINVNINSPDTFIFVVMPSILLAVSWIYFFRRYHGMWCYYCHNEELENKSGFHTDVRYLIVAGDRLYLTQDDNLNLIDTPVKYRLPLTTGVDNVSALTRFRDYTGLTPAKLKLAYISDNTYTLSNVIHYICFFENESQLDGIKKSGEFYTIEQLQFMIKNKKVSPSLESELRRIYTVAMTWKTYSPSGMRLYAIRNYRPTFRLIDMHKWDVDYNDKNWLTIASLNQDKPFWKIRKFMHKYFNKF